jgi:hypothetical protein
VSERSALAGMVMLLTQDSPAAINAELAAIVALFFTVRSCKCATAVTPGKTKTINLPDVISRDRNRQIPHESPDLTAAKRPLLTFEDQKNDENDDTHLL